MIYSDTRDKRTGQKFAVDLLLARVSVVFLGMMTLFLSATSAQSPHLNGHGAMSAQDIQKMVAGPLSSSSSTGACPDLAAGSTITAPTDLYSQNGVLEVTLNLQTDVDAAGRQRYCYVTNTGLVSPNLRVNPGDTLLIHFNNQLPAGLIPVVPQVMPSMPGMDSMSHGLTNGMAAGMRVTLHGTPQAGAYPSITVALDFRDPNIVGTFVYHCHILQHEDAGMMGAIEVLPSGAASTAVIASSTASTTPAASTNLTATVASSVTGGSTPTGQVQFQSNGLDLGNPATVTNGVATLSVAGSSLQNGANSVQAFYMGDAYYAESLSNTTTVTNTPFSLTGTGTSAAIGSAANASLNLIIASGYTNAVQLTCALPSNLTEAACFINPSSVVGGGPATLTVNTTPVHASLRESSHPGIIFPASAGALSALLLPFIRRKRRFKLGSMMAVVLCAGLVAVIGCSGGTGKTDPGTLAGTYNVTVTATGLSGTTL